MFTRRNKRANLYLNAYRPSIVEGGDAVDFPSDIAGLTLHLKADDGPCTDAALTDPATNGENVRGWIDYSGLDYDFVEANVLRVPTLVTNVQNGLPVVRFLDGFLISTPRVNSNFISASACTMFVVLSVASIATNAANSWGNDTVIGNNSGYWGLTLKQTNDVQFYNYDGSDDKVTSSVTLGGACAAFMCRHESGNIYISKNAGVEASAASGNTQLISDLIYIGDGIGTGIPLKGDIAEILIYNVALSTLNISRVYAYLNYKWGLY